MKKQRGGDVCSAALAAQGSGSIVTTGNSISCLLSNISSTGSAISTLFTNLGGNMSLITSPPTLPIS